jgi:hypothetical protein
MPVLQESKENKRVWRMSTIGGLLLLIAVGLSLIVITDNPAQRIMITVMIDMVALLLQILTVIGAIMALRKSKGIIAIIGSISGILLIGPYGLSTILSFISLILFIKGINEFNE